MPKPILEIDGSCFDTLNGFWDEFSVRLIPGTNILRGGFGTPEGGFKLRLA